jgi:hypothetical protein
MWHIDPLLGKDLETHNEIKAVAIQQHGKHASTPMELLLEMVLCNLLLGSCSNWTTTVEMGVFSMWSVPRSWGNPFQLSVESQPVKRSLGRWCEIATSLGPSHLRIGSWVELCEEGWEEVALKLSWQLTRVQLRDICWTVMMWTQALENFTV